MIKYLLLLFCVSCAWFDNTIICDKVQVKKVTDGDSLLAAISDIPVKVRMVGIDAPELASKKNPHDQPFGIQAKDRLTELVQGKEVRLVGTAHGYYNRFLATVFLGGENINLLMVREGLATCYPQRGKSHPCRVLEDAAHAARRGLWSQDTPIRPDRWRKKTF